jgi:hypothetical protein
MCDGEQPGLQWTAGFIRMASFEDRHEDFLINVLDFLRLGDSSS